jgi:hypothetical protein
MKTMPAALASAVLVLAAIAANGQASVADEPLVTLTDFTPGVILDGRATLQSHYNPSNMLRLAVILKPAHPEEARQYLEDLQDKNSPSFHQFLSPEEWADRFGPTREAEQSVLNWAQKNGFTVTYRYNHRMAVDLEAPAGVIERALHVTINSYQLPELNGHEARTAFSSDRDPQLPASLGGTVDAVLGLNSVAVLRPAAGSGRVAPQPDYIPGPAIQDMGSAQADAEPDAVRELSERLAPGPEVKPPPAGYFEPSDYFSAYGYDYQALMNQGHCCNPTHTSGHSPRESSIAIAAFGDVSFSDIAGFRSAFPYLNYNVSKIGVDGGYTCNNSNGFDSNCGEVTMDTEWSLAMANNGKSSTDTARVVVYEAPDFGTQSISDVYTHMDADAHARTASVSFAYVESDGSEFTNNEMQTLDSDIFGPMAGMGWTLLGASGDQGATGGCDDALRVEFPASDPHFVAVGGTEYSMYTSGPEVAWTGSQSLTNAVKSCNGNNGGGTGGFSEYFGVPSYQSGMGFPSRSVPDLSLDAFYGHDVYVNNGWAHLGGTSVSTPMMAGFFAQANAYLLSIGNKCGSKGTAACAPIGNANYPIYAEGKSERANAGNQAGHVPFYDTTKGCNSNGVTIEYKLKAYCAKEGYDQATGWGSSNMLQLAWAINWELGGAYGTPYVTFSGPETHKWYNSNQTVRWKINDFSGKSSIPGTGIAGEAQGWDSLASDPRSEPRGLVPSSTNNFFFSGPQFVNDSKGCLAFINNGCTGLSGTTAQIQGCHTVHVRGWNNQGESTADNKSYPETYGPICYDTVAPTTELINNPPKPSASGFFTQPVIVTVKASDPGGSDASGISKIFFTDNNAACKPTATSQCTEYKSPITISTPGTHNITVFAQDHAGNMSIIENEQLKIDTTDPTIAFSNTPPLPASGWYTTSVIVKLNATDPGSAAPGVANIYYAINNAACAPSGLSHCQTYSLPIFDTSPGTETVTAFSEDKGGNYSIVASEPIKIDNIPPVTKAGLSGNLVSGQWQSAVTVVLTATDNASGVKTTYYSLDGGETVTYAGSFKISTAGSHTLSYWSVDVAGNTETAQTATFSIDSPTTMALTASSNPSVIGQPVTLSATVTPALTGTPTGTVSFYNGSALLGTGTLTGGVATLSTTALSLGANSLQATYPGASFFLAASPALLTETVVTLPTATTSTPVLSFNPAAIGISAGSAQTLTASFAVSGSYIPTAIAHYGHDYTLGAVSCSGLNGVEICTVPVTFIPTLPGARKDTVQLMAGSTILATALLGGTGQGPMALMQPGVVTSPLSGAPYYIYQSVVDENGTVYFLVDDGNAVYSLAKGSSTPSTVPVTGLSSPHGIDIDGSGTLYIAQNGYGSNIVTYNTVTGAQGSISVVPTAPYKPCTTLEYLYSVAVDDAGNLFALEIECSQIFELKADGSYATTGISPVMTQPDNIAVDSTDDVFIGGYDINELTAGGVQTQINTVGASEGLLVDAAGTLYATRYTAGGVAQLAASSYSTAAFTVDPTSSPLGEGLGSDGTLYVGNYTSLDKVDRSQGLVAFGEQTAGFESTAQDVSLYNGGNQSLTILGVAISGAPFNLLPGGHNNCTIGLVIAAGASCEVAVTVTPEHAGTYSGTVTFTSNSLNTTSTVQTVTLTAYVYGVYMVPSPATLAFPNQTTGTTSAASSVMLTNEGNLYAGAIGTPVSSDPAFSATLGTCTASVSVGSSCQISVTFSPTLAQEYSATITVPASSTGGGVTPSATFRVNGQGVTKSARTPRIP